MRWRLNNSQCPTNPLPALHLGTSSPSNAEQQGRCGWKKCIERNWILIQAWLNSPSKTGTSGPGISGVPGRARRQRTRPVATLALEQRLPDKGLEQLGCHGHKTNPSNPSGAPGPLPKGRLWLEGVGMLWMTCQPHWEPISEHWKQRLKWGVSNSPTGSPVLSAGNRGWSGVCPGSPARHRRQHACSRAPPHAVLGARAFGPPPLPGWLLFKLRPSILSSKVHFVNWRRT